MNVTERVSRARDSIEKAETMMRHANAMIPVLTSDASDEEIAAVASLITASERLTVVHDRAISIRRQIERACGMAWREMDIVQETDAILRKEDSDE